MNVSLRLAIAGILLLTIVGCSRSPATASAGASRLATAQSAEPATTAAPIAQGFASLPDRGELIAYPRQPVRRDGAYTWHRTDLSEAHALNAIADGKLRLTTPSGETLVVRYDRHIEHGSGDWTWVGHIPGQEGEQTILTFGPHAAFGSIAQPGKPPLRLTVRNGVSWLVETDPTKVAGIINAATRPQRPDYHVPPKSAVPDSTAAAPSAPSRASAPVMAAATTTSTPTTVDLVLGYTPAFASDNGGQSGAITRLNYLVDVTNISYGNSSINARVRLVATVPVSYPDNTSNDTTLDQLTGYNSSTNTTTSPNSAFSGLRAAREQYGADLVSMVRSFRDPENGGCGVGWLIGGSQQGISTSDSYYGYSVVSDGTDAGTDGHTYFCLDETLAHELGHNMGAQHDVATAKGTDGVLNPGDYGAYAYSFGYKNATNAFYTVMAYGDTGQHIYRIFSDPRSTFCGGAICGTSQADNARTLSQTIATIASFRATVVTLAPPSDLYAIDKMGASTELHPLSAVNLFQTFTNHFATALQQTGTNYTWRFQMGDYNRDGVLDMYAIGRSGSSGRTEVHVLNGADGYQTFLAHIATALGATGSDNSWIFELGDYNRDGILDLYAINRNGGSGRTEVHVLNGATNFTTYLDHVATALGSTGSDGSWDFALGDFNHDGIADLYTFSKLGGSGTTEVHVLNGANAFQTFLLHSATALQNTGPDNRWVFKVGDFDGDGILDIYAIDKQGASGRTEVHVLDGASGFRAFSAHIATALQSTGTDDSWEFELAARP